MEVVVVVVVVKGVFGGPSGPSREGPGVGHKIVSDTEQMTKERKKEKKEWEKGKCVKKKKMEERERKKWTEINGKRYRNALRHGQKQKY